MTDGLYILANDVVFDQMVALLNSIEVNVSVDFPVCIIPYDDRLDQVQAEINRRPQVQLLTDQGLIARWEDFAAQVWGTHPTAFQTWQQQGKTGVYRLGMHRRFAVFEGMFDRFFYLDADTLILSDLKPLFAKLNNYDWVVYDFQYKDPTHVYNVHSPEYRQVFSQQQLESDMFCAGLYGSKLGLFDQQKRQKLIEQLKAGDSNLLYMPAPDQSILNYMVMRSKLSVCNLARELPPEERTGCCVTSPHFREENGLVYDQERPLTYLHYIGLSAQYFTRLCAGENLDVPYRETFLHYRYLREPEKRPKFSGKPKPYNPPPSLASKVLKKLGLK